MMTVLEIIRAACGTIGIQRPNSAIGSSDSGVVQLLELFNEEGSELAARSSGNEGWQALVREATFTTAATESQGTLTSIIGAANAYRSVLNETMWDRTAQEPIFGPKPSLDWQALKAFNVTGPYQEYRIRGNQLLFVPAPTAGHSIYFEYSTKNWLTSSDGSQQRSRATNDEDVPLLDDELILAGLKWRWKQSKGLDFGQDFDKYERRVVDALAKDGTKARKSLLGGCIDSNVPIAIPRLIGS